MRRGDHVRIFEVAVDVGAETEELALTGREDEALPVAGREEDEGLEMPLLVGAADDTERLVADALMAVEDALRVLAGALDASDVLRGASLVAELLAGTAMTAPPRARTWRKRCVRMANTLGDSGGLHLETRAYVRPAFYVRGAKDGVRPGG